MALSPEPVKQHYQLVIIGGGPTGLSAAVAAAGQGVEVALLDDQKQPGGQIYRAMESVPADRAQLLGSEYQRGDQLVQAFRQSGVAYFPETQVWSLNTERLIGFNSAGKPAMIQADRVILANGAMERPVPFAGWTLPGVMNAGAGQILFKAHGIVPEDGVVLAGSGPLLLLLATQYLHAGVKIGQILDLTPMRNHLRALPHLPRALLARHYLLKGLAYKKELKLAGINTLHNVSDLRAHGEHKLQSISFNHQGNPRQIDTNLLLVHFGVIPHSHLARSAGCTHSWNKLQQCWHPDFDDWGNSSVRGIQIAGDGAAIGGARTAEHAGRVVAFEAACALGKISRSERDVLAREDQQWMREELNLRPFLDAFFHIPQKMLKVPDDDTIVCRCEEITAGQIRQAVAYGHHDSNQVKFLTRSGMGACQGRQCEQAVANIVAAAGGQSLDEGGHYRGRPPITPLTLGQLATLFPEERE
jgi:NADPH-dependent 2,4-dienoyl-CoA reductase/sulfur reductase-like enzyme